MFFLVKFSYIKKSKREFCVRLRGARSYGACFLVIFSRGMLEKNKKYLYISFFLPMVVFYIVVFFLNLLKFLSFVCLLLLCCLMVDGCFFVLCFFLLSFMRDCFFLFHLFALRSSLCLNYLIHCSKSANPIQKSHIIQRLEVVKQ